MGTPNPTANDLKGMNFNLPAFDFTSIAVPPPAPAANATAPAATPAPAAVAPTSVPTAPFKAPPAASAPIAAAQTVAPTNPISQQQIANNAANTANVMAAQPESPDIKQMPVNPYAMTAGGTPAATPSTVGPLSYPMNNISPNINNTKNLTRAGSIGSSDVSSFQNANPSVASNTRGFSIEDVTNPIKDLVNQIPVVGPAITSLPGQIGDGLGQLNPLKANTPTIAPTDMNLLNNSINNLGFQQTSLGNVANQQIGASNNAQGQTATANALLQGAAQGNAPSAAQMQLQAGNDAAINQQMAMANSGNLSQMISGQRNAMQNEANLGQQNANNAAQLRAQEMATARGQYSQGAGQALGTNLGATTNLLGLQNQAVQSNSTAQQNVASLEQQRNIAQSGAQLGASGQMLGLIGGAMGAGASAASAAAKYEGGYIDGPEIEKGNSLKNDVVPILASGGEIIIPKENAQSLPKAMAFLKELMSKSEEKESNDSDSTKELFKHKKKK